LVIKIKGSFMENWRFIKYLFLLPFFLVSCQPAESNIKYTATGSSGGLTVNYVDATGTSQTYNGSSPWELNFSAKSGAQLSVTASNGPNDTSTVDIYINGADKAHDTETGVSSTASITVP
jgi:hypothetical protein